MKREFQIEFLKARGLSPSSSLCDVGCGTLRGGIPFIQYLEAGKYFGIDTRKEVIQEAWKEVRDAKLEHKAPVLVCTSFPDTIKPTSDFDYIWAFSVLFHMADEYVESTFKFVGACLKENGTFYANVNIGEVSDGSWQGFPVVTRQFSFYERLGTRNSLNIRDCGTLDELGHKTGIDTQDKQAMLAFTRSDSSQ